MRTVLFALVVAVLLLTVHVHAQMYANMGFNARDLLLWNSLDSPAEGVSAMGPDLVAVDGAEIPFTTEGVCGRALSVDLRFMVSQQDDTVLVGGRYFDLNTGAGKKRDSIAQEIASQGTISFFARLRGPNFEDDVLVRNSVWPFLTRYVQAQSQLVEARPTEAAVAVDPSGLLAMAGQYFVGSQGLNDSVANPVTFGNILPLDGDADEPLSGWHHYALTWNSAGLGSVGGSVALYVDGVIFAVADNSDCFTQGPVPNPTTVGPPPTTGTSSGASGSSSSTTSSTTSTTSTTTTTTATATTGNLSSTSMGTTTMGTRRRSVEEEMPMVHHEARQSTNCNFTYRRGGVARLHLGSLMPSQAGRILPGESNIDIDEFQVWPTSINVLSFPIVSDCDEGLTEELIKLSSDDDDTDGLTNAETFAIIFPILCCVGMIIVPLIIALIVWMRLHPDDENAS